VIKSKVPQEVKDAVDGLTANRAFKRLVVWVFNALEETRVQNDTLEGTELARNQGCAIALAKILKVFEGNDT
jgi:hypothetical protein